MSIFLACDELIKKHSLLTIYISMVFKIYDLKGIKKYSTKI